jgi:hypothetical protein
MVEPDSFAKHAGTPESSDRFQCTLMWPVAPFQHEFWPSFHSCRLTMMHLSVCLGTSMSCVVSCFGRACPVRNVFCRRVGLHAVFGVHTLWRLFRSASCIANSVRLCAWLSRAAVADWTTGFFRVWVRWQMQQALVQTAASVTTLELSGRLCQHFGLKVFTLAALWCAL